MTSRRRRAASKKATALGDVIARSARDLEGLAVMLNGEAWREPDRALMQAAADVVDAAADLEFPFVGPRAAERFGALADGETYRYAVLAVQPQPHTPKRLHGVVMITLRGSGPRGVVVQTLARFLRNPARDRLRRCDQCRRWFVDTTRNKSARRCSRVCTIAWSNKQRPKKGDGR